LSRTLLLSLFSTGLFFFLDPSPTEIYTLSLHDALPISAARCGEVGGARGGRDGLFGFWLGGGFAAAAGAGFFLGPGWDGHRERRSEEHTSELQSRGHLVCRLLLEKKKKKY